MSTLSYHFPEFAIGAVSVVSNRSVGPWSRPGGRSARYGRTTDLCTLRALTSKHQRNPLLV